MDEMRKRNMDEMRKSNISADGLEDISNKVPTVNPLTPKSDKHLISPYKITSDSHLRSWELRK